MNASRRPPPALPGRARALLDEYRDAQTIPADVEARIWTVVGADDAPDPVFDPLEIEGEGEADDELSAASQRRVWPWVGLGLAAAAALLVAWGLGGMIAERRQAVATPDTAVMRAQTESSPRRALAQQPSAAKATVPAAAEVESVEPPIEPAEPPPPHAQQQPRASKPPRPSARAGRTETEAETEPSQAPVTPPDTLAAERALVARAWRALAHGNTAEALQRVEEHARQFGDGLLVPEARAVEVIARCRQGDDARARAQAQTFHAEHPHSPLAARVDEACGAGQKK